MFASKNLVDSDPKTLEIISKGWFKALDFINTNPDEAYKIMGDAFGIPKEEMMDFKTGISWLNLNNNKQMFEQGSDTYAPMIFEKVGDILEKNEETDIRVKSNNHLTDKIIKGL